MTTPRLAAISAGLLALASSGCATASHQTWTRAGATPEDLGRDRYACIQQSRVPFDTSFGGASVNRYGGSATWGSSGGYAQGGTDGGFIFLGAVRHAQSQANRAFDACMESRGWQAGTGIAGAGPPPPSAASVAPVAAPVATPARTAGISGTFAGSVYGIQGNASFAMAVSFTIVQTEDKIAGAWTSASGTSGTMTATVVDNALADVRVKQINPCVGEFVGVATIEDAGLRLRGSYLGKACGSPVNASFVVTRQTLSGRRAARATRPPMPDRQQRPALLTGPADPAVTPSGRISDSLNSDGAAASLRHEFHGSDVTESSPIAVAIDATLAQLIPWRACCSITSINGRALGEQGNVPAAGCAVVNERAETRVTNEIRRDKVDRAICRVADDVVAE